MVVGALAAVAAAAASLLVKQGRVVEKEIARTKTMCELAEEMDATPYVRLLKDPQDVQLPAAKSKGLRAPLPDRRAVRATPPGTLVPLRDNPLYTVAAMSYSVPTVTPAAASLLEEIGRRFQARLSALHLAGFRPVVTSGLRTLDDQRELHESGNVNAVPESAHFYGTTIDLAYMRWQSPDYPFDRIALASMGELSEARQCRNQVLKTVLAQTLLELRREKRAYVMHEGLRQACFHVTAR